MRNSERLKKALNSVDKAVDRGDFPGATIAIGSSDGVEEMYQYGKSALYPKALDLNIDTLYDLASLTKVVGTTTLYMRFIEMGLVTLHDRVADYMPEFKGGEKDKVTLFNLLTHTSGLPDHLPFYELCSDYRDTIDYIANLELEYLPGTRVIYSDLGFILLGYILEEIGGSRLDHLFNKYIFTPLGMKNTCFNPTTDNVAATEIDKSTGKAIVGKCHDENGRFFGGISGHAGLFSDIGDMVKFSNMLINGGRIGEDIFLSSAAFETMIRNYTQELDEDRGIGWCVKGEKGRISSGGDLISPSAFGHTGFTGTSIWTDIEQDIYIVLLTNRVHPTRENNALLRFRRTFHNSVLAAKI